MLPNIFQEALSIRNKFKTEIPDVNNMVSMFQNFEVLPRLNFSAMKEIIFNIDGYKKLGLYDLWFK